MDKDEYRRQVNEFQQECKGGKSYEMVIFQADMLDPIMEQAAKLEPRAVHICAAIAEWVLHANTHGAGCWGCDKRIEKGHVAVIGCVIPKNNEGTGMCACLCTDCRKVMTPDQAMAKLRSNLVRDFPSLTVHTVQ